VGSNRRRTARLLLAAFAFLACTQNGGTAQGVVVAVEGDLTEVSSFTLLVEGDQLTFVPVPEGDYPYPLSHLRDHLRDGAPVLVTWERSGDKLLALKLEDA
jgi:hypothetical protein